MSDSATLEREIEQVLKGMLDSVSEVEIAAYGTVASLPVMARAAAMAQAGESEQFHFALVYPLRRFIDGLLGAHIPDSHQARFILGNRDFVRRHIGEVISRVEGFECRGDKTRTVINALMRHYLTGQRIRYDWAEEYTFHLPHTVFTTHEETVEFLEALEALHAGMPMQYFKVMATIMQLPRGAGVNAPTTTVTRSVSVS